ncbi:MAG TPA: class I SAM-dependent methyltransferase [Gemmatimonadales bacterium]|nr:class I SAM-dependent methyltransferase [Gemmatimonadales bacterium]
MSSRRDAVPFDPRHFEKLSDRGEAASSSAAIFRDIYQRNHWSGPESRSGLGAGAEQTGALAEALPDLLHRLGVGVLLDLPCGEFEWMGRIELPVERYIGADLLPELIRPLQERSGSATRSFVVLDLTRDPLPPADLLLCRDCLVHLSFADIRRALVNVVRSGIPWLLTTTFPRCELNEDIVTGDWRPLDLEREPFRLPAPFELVNERCTEGDGLFGDKSLGLWRTADLPALPFLTA